MTWPLNGVLVDVSHSGIAIVIEDVSDQLKDHLRSVLSRICYGQSMVQEDEDHYSFTKTCQEFVRRYDAKSHETQTGMIGELLTHAFAESVYADLTNFSVFFNKEERSIKKGFDLTFTSSADSKIWYAEVKSGAPKEETPGTKLSKLATLAASDLKAKFGTPDRQSIWHSAIIDASMTLGQFGSASVKSLLRRHSDDPSSAEFNVLIAAGVFHPVADAAIASLDFDEILASIKLNHSFEEVRLLAIQKSTIDKVAQFLRDEAVA